MMSKFLITTIVLGLASQGFAKGGERETITVGTMNRERATKILNGMSEFLAQETGQPNKSPSNPAPTSTPVGVASVATVTQDGSVTTVFTGPAVVTSVSVDTVTSSVLVPVQPVQDNWPPAPDCTSTSPDDVSSSPDDNGVAGSTTPEDPDNGTCSPPEVVVVDESDGSSTTAEISDMTIIFNSEPTDGPIEQRNQGARFMVDSYEAAADEDCRSDVGPLMKVIASDARDDAAAFLIDDWKQVKDAVNSHVKMDLQAPVFQKLPAHCKEEVKRSQDHSRKFVEIANRSDDKSAGSRTSLASGAVAIAIAAFVLLQ